MRLHALDEGAYIYFDSACIDLNAVAPRGKRRRRERGRERKKKRTLQKWVALHTYTKCKAETLKREAPGQTKKNPSRRQQKANTGPPPLPPPSRLHDGSAEVVLRVGTTRRRTFINRASGSAGWSIVSPNLSSNATSGRTAVPERRP